jgi:NitT/TauT family transport system substrate-binding protein
MRVPHRALVSGAAAVLALGLSACGGDSGAESSDPDARLSISMAMASEDTYTAEWFGWAIADELGYYDDLNLDVEFNPAGGSGEAVEQLAAGNVEAGNPSMPSVGEGLLGGLPLVDIFTYSNGAIFGIFAPTDSDITEIADLDGKRIGISEPGGGEVAFLEAALLEEGIDPISDVSLIPIGAGGPETFTAIEEGRVDAYSTAYNDIFALQTAGLDLNDLTPDIFNTFPARGIITTQDMVEEQPEALRRLARGTAMGIHFCFSNLKACEDIMKKAIPAAFEENAQGVSQGELRFDLAETQVKPTNPDVLGEHQDEATADFLDTIASTMEGDPSYDLEAFLNDDFLEYANDFDREAVEQDAREYTG